MTDDSITKLSKRLGIEAGHRVGVVNVPATFVELLEPLPAGAELLLAVRSRRDVVVAFLRERGELESKVDALTRAIAADGPIWVAWPMQSAADERALTEAIIRDVARRVGLTDGEVIAIDDTWSAVRLVAPAR